MDTERGATAAAIEQHETTKPFDVELREGSPVLEFSELGKSYGKVHALNGLNIKVRAGQVYGFLGRNGAGKSTAIRIAMGITKPTVGAVRLFGQSLSPSAVAVRQRIGYVAQEQNFYGWMTTQVIGEFVSGFFPTWSSAEYERLIAMLELPTDRKIQTFSGGMRAKLALALALAHRPELLVLDEPTAGLDAVARREFIQMVREQAQRSGRTTFFSSHLIDEVEAAADQVGIVEDGRTIYEGPLSVLSDCVRKFAGPRGAEAPAALLQPPLRVLQSYVFQDRRELVVYVPRSVQLTQLEIPASWTEVSMSLEDIFVALVAKPLKRASHAAVDAGADL